MSASEPPVVLLRVPPHPLRSLTRNSYRACGLISDFDISFREPRRRTSTTMLYTQVPNRGRPGGPESVRAGGVSRSGARLAVYAAPRYPPGN